MPKKKKPLYIKPADDSASDLKPQLVKEASPVKEVIEAPSTFTSKNLDTVEDLIRKFDGIFINMADELKRTITVAIGGKIYENEGVNLTAMGFVYVDFNKVVERFKQFQTTVTNVNLLVKRYEELYQKCADKKDIQVLMQIAHGPLKTTFETAMKDLDAFEQTHFPK